MVTVLTKLDKETLIPRMRERGVDVRPFFYPLSALPAYRSHPSAAGARERNPNAYAISPSGINLPSGYNMTPALVEQVCDTLLATLDG